MDQEHSAFRKAIEQVCQGSEEAAWEFIAEYGPHIQRVVRRKLRQHQLTQQMQPKFDSVDFVQMVWASFFTEREKLSRFKEPSELIGYLAGMAANKVLQESRRRMLYQKHNVNRECRIGDSGGDESSFVRRPTTPSHVVMAREQVDELMRGRSERDQRILMLRMSGATFEEIGEKVGIHERTARLVVEKVVLAEADA